jgi:hypothetical protein
LLDIVPHPAGGDRVSHPEGRVLDRLLKDFQNVRRFNLGDGARADQRNDPLT